MSDNFRHILEHFPFIMATGQTLTPDWRSLFGAAIISGVSVAGGGYIATKEMAVELRVQARAIESLTQRFDQATLSLQARDERMVTEHRNLSERLTRVEEKQSSQHPTNGMSGMNGYPALPRSR